MSINFKTVREALRKRVISASGINPVTQFVESNHEFNPQGVTLWAREYTIGGAERMFSTKRSRISSFLVQYDFFVPLNSGTDAMDEVMAAIMTEFDLADAEKTNVESEGLDIIVKSVDRSSDTQKDLHREKLLFTLDVTTS